MAFPEGSAAYMLVMEVLEQSLKMSKIRLFLSNADPSSTLQWQMSYRTSLSTITVATVRVTASVLLRLLLLLLLGLLRLRSGRQSMCRVLLSSLLVLPWFHFFLPHVFPSASSARLWVSSTLSSSRACSAALLAARRVRRRPRAVRRCGPLSTRIHRGFFHHVMCLFDTSLSSCIEFVSFFSSTLSSCLVISSLPSYPSCALTLLSSFLGSS